MQNRVKELIVSLGTNQEEFSKNNGLCKASVSNWCNQKHQPDLPFLVQISEKYSVDILWLAGY